MTYEEAIKTINKNLQVSIHDLEGLEPEYEKEQVAALTLSREALEKQIPKKPIIVGYSKILKCNIYGCPNCGDTQNSNEYFNKYCWNCGQMLKWPEE